MPAEVWPSVHGASWRSAARHGLGVPHMPIAGRPAGSGRPSKSASPRLRESSTPERRAMTQAITGNRFPARWPNRRHRPGPSMTRVSTATGAPKVEEGSRAAEPEREFGGRCLVVFAQQYRVGAVAVFGAAGAGQAVAMPMDSAQGNGIPALSARLVSCIAPPRVGGGQAGGRSSSSQPAN